ncbi:hypothetical protein BDY24DRAFT_104184 [Mrakia frigida]|uniref:uncharacterized protein n=1 Tax=Mrakia frigida TaxID=29902 RepID=UPI003FCC02F8
MHTNDDTPKKKTGLYACARPPSALPSLVSPPTSTRPLSLPLDDHSPSFASLFFPSPLPPPPLPPIEASSSASTVLSRSLGVRRLASPRFLLPLPLLSKLPRIVSFFKSLPSLLSFALYLLLVLYRRRHSSLFNSNGHPVSLPLATHLKPRPPFLPSTSTSTDLI